MTVHVMLKRTKASGVKKLHFWWGDSTIEVSVASLAQAVECYVGEDVDEHTRLDWMEAARDWLQQMRGGIEEDQMIAHLIWCLNLSREWEDFATRIIHTAVVEALLRKEKIE